MGGPPKGDPSAFADGQLVRYRPGSGTYGYEEAIESDGCIPAEVVGRTRQRVRIKFKLTEFGYTSRAVDAASLVKVGLHGA